MPYEPTDNAEPLPAKKIEPLEIKSLAKELVILLLIVVFVRTFVASPFRISGNSMESSYHDKEFILVDKFSYADFGLFRVGDPKRGDVVILRPHAANGKEFYIKRVIGISGDKIEFKEGEISILKKNAREAVKIDESGYLNPFNKGRTYLPNDVRTSVFEVPEGQYFVMGDNRGNSSDSRSCFRTCLTGDVGHFLLRSDIIGKVFLDIGYFKIFEHFSLAPFDVQLAKEPEWISRPRFFDTPRNWKYPELEVK